eukprot:1160154-Pelagomonas_calceolata.AAC.5
MNGLAGSACRVSGRMVGWLAQAKNYQQKFPIGSYSASRCLSRPLILQGCLKLLSGRIAKIPGQGVPRTGQGS